MSNTIHCPHCGKEYEVSVTVINAELSSVEWEILDIIERYAKHHPGGVLDTRYIADIIRLGMDQTRRYLIKLERRGKIVRIGKRGGWCES